MRDPNRTNGRFNNNRRIVYQPGQIINGRKIICPGRTVDGYAGWVCECMNCGNIIVLRTNIVKRTFKTGRTHCRHCVNGSTNRENLCEDKKLTVRLRETWRRGVRFGIMCDQWIDDPFGFINYVYNLGYDGTSRIGRVDTSLPYQEGNIFFFNTKGSPNSKWLLKNREGLPDD